MQTVYPLRAWICLSLCVAVCAAEAQWCDFTLRTVCALLSMPHAVGHCKCPQWLFPLSDTGSIEVGLLSRGCLNTQRNSFFLVFFILSSFAFFDSHLFLPPFRSREVNGFGLLIGIQRKRYLCSPRCIRCPDWDLYFVCCEWGGEVMSQDESCSRVGSRCCYSCHWERRHESKRKVSIFKPHIFFLSMFQFFGPGSWDLIDSWYEPYMPALEPTTATEWSFRTSDPLLSPLSWATNTPAYSRSMNHVTSEI